MRKNKTELAGYLFKAFVVLFFTYAVLFYAGTFVVGLVLRDASYSSGSAVSSNQAGSLALTISICSLAASILSMIGFVSATILSWRKENRESHLHDVELEKKELEIAKLRRELGIENRPEVETLNSKRRGPLYQGRAIRSVERGGNRKQRGSRSPTPAFERTADASAQRHQRLIPGG